MFKVITGTLQANHNTLQLTDETITNDSIFEVYADTENVIPSSVSVGGHTVTVTFDSKPSNNVGIKVLINNIVGEFALDLDHIDANNVYYENPFIGSQPIGNAFADLEVNYQGVALPLLNSIDDELHTDTVLGGVLYHATTGNMWKKLDASNINYDDDSTIYSAMGDIDELETENKNLVGAVNELNNKPSGGFNISTVESKLGKKFFDKDVYVKAYTFTTDIQTSGKSVTSSIVSNLAEIESIVDAYYIQNNTSGKTFSKLACYFTDANTLNVRSMFGISANGNGVLVLEYTKKVV